MSEQNTNTFEAAFEEQRRQNEETLFKIGEELKGIFSDEKQCEVVTELYRQVFKVSFDIEELNRQSIFLSSFIDGLQEHLVGENKLISEDVYIDSCQKAFQASIEEINKAFTAMSKETE